MPDKDDKNSGHTSLPRQYERDKKEVEEIEDGHKPSFKSANDREAKAARNEQESRKESRDVEEARSVPATEQG
ncbi:hypothetical protein E5F05_17940 [Deinococcus metallilatus]|uniref:Uncharacterized protein n=2 Tax=Deinococcus TaxID=1298 RepID=A0AAJ5F3V9_9DEIO|nr:hypothetical protein [Deinococcus metallilatus]MBB5297235.1 hypothetical protein [Deinococcus metallilatus]QBY09653.1 hypothetical protein E5F05_17940 [Deinococcus metallilatus]RXJ09025.1 hypothetical protein ERJ73_16780 [Deinococcus metallilatus]TLK21280.1 hypothetical protein FCS05_19070 [Deinococcus metallilatus]GMA17178.1 hypothetical protein GCM10025871_35090 [Deinococcus metallilatus]